ncbi:MAG: hypothetical protein NTX81_02215, partial [Candidatus Bathyarchaeota archaeon]|nr:hypothetical protein [Candidatus Bathyarchaeota archaeon]
MRWGKSTDKTAFENLEAFITYTIFAQFLSSLDLIASVPLGQTRMNGQYVQPELGSGSGVSE